MPKEFTSQRMIIMLIAVAAVFGGVFGYQAFGAYMASSFFASQGEPAQTVATTRAAFQEWQPRLEAVGTTRASVGADLSFELPGTVASINFKSGDEVKKGTLLIGLVDQDDLAKLRSLEAASELAAVNHARSLKLFAKKFVSQAALDQTAANLKNARAQIAEQQALIAKKNIRAPFSGRLGIRNVDIGQYLTAGQSFVTLQALDPIYVDFLLPQQALEQLKPGLQVRARVDTFPQQTFPGTIDAINAKVDVASRNVQVRASFSNPDGKLLPGMYATVAIDAGVRQRFLTLPQTAIVFNPYGNTVFAIENKGRGPDGRPQFVARQTFVTTGSRRGDQIAVLSGVKEGSTIVTAGQIKLRNNTPVTINNALQQRAAADPTTANQ
jgi:membrane fusion protein, multidrug efflux system